jgi:hypothetical protein
MAPRSAASFDMTVKMVVPTLGSFDFIVRCLSLAGGQQFKRTEGILS